MSALHCSIPAFQGFLGKSRGIASGWISFYWGGTIAECRKSRKLEDALMAAWLEFIKEQALASARPRPWFRRRSSGPQRARAAVRRRVRAAYLALFLSHSSICSALAR